MPRHCAPGGWFGSQRKARPAGSGGGMSAGVSHKQPEVTCGQGGLTHKRQGCMLDVQSRVRCSAGRERCTVRKRNVERRGEREGSYNF